MIRNEFLVVDNDGIVKCPDCGTKLDMEELSAVVCGKCGSFIRSVEVNNLDYARPIYKYDLEGSLVDSYKNIYEAFPNKKEKSLRIKVIDCCRKKKGKVSNYQWAFGSKNTVENIGAYDPNYKRKIIMITFEGKKIEYSYAGEAAEELGHTLSTITKACKQKKPIFGERYFLFFAREYSDDVLRAAIEKYNHSTPFISVQDPEGNETLYDTMSDAAWAIGTSLTNVSNWTENIFLPSGRYEGYKLCKKQRISTYILVS